MNVDVSTAIGLWVPAAFVVFLLMFPRLAGSRWIGLFSLAAAGCYFYREFPGFVVVSAAGYAALRWLSGEATPARRWNQACALMILVVVVFTLGRIEDWGRLWNLPVIGSLSLYTLGMWHLLRFVSLFWEVGSNAAPAPSVTQYVLWMCLPFTLGGPLMRWSQMPADFTPDRRILKSLEWWVEAAAASVKLAAGLGLAAADQYMGRHWPQLHLLKNGFLTFVAGPLGFYLSTAGYFQWMEVLARACGLKVPESFRSPIGRESISAFWMNWNMTATFLFRDYLFYNRWGRQSFNPYFNTILLFTLVGLWHSANAYWILWGFLHGLLFTSYLLWRRYGQGLSLPLRGTILSRTAARVTTYFCVCMAWYLPSKILQVTGA